MRDEEKNTVLYACTLNLPQVKLNSFKFFPKISFCHFRNKNERCSIYMNNIKKHKETVTSDGGNASGGSNKTCGEGHCPFLQQRGKLHLVAYSLPHVTALRVTS